MLLLMLMLLLQLESLMTDVEIMKSDAVDVEKMEVVFCGDGDCWDGEIGDEYDGGDGDE